MEQENGSNFVTKKDKSEPNIGQSLSNNQSTMLVLLQTFELKYILLKKGLNEGKELMFVLLV